MRKLILIGNGFDLAHGLKTSYKDFIEKYHDHPILCEFKKLVRCEFNENKENWYDFEVIYEKIVNSIFKENFCGNMSSKKISNLEMKVKKCNEIFEEVTELLKEYLKDEMSKKVNKLQSVEKEIGSDAYIISFNYTDTVNLYSKKISYIHGSISEDNFIILGFAEGNVPDAMEGSDYIRFYKEPLKEKLNFIRYLNCNSYGEQTRLLQEFEVQLKSLFSGYGGYHLMHDGDNIINLSREIQHYAEINHYYRANLDLDIKNVQEIVVMGHGLESDCNYISEMFRQITGLETLTLFTFPEENHDNLHRKITKLKKWSGLSNVIVKSF